MSVKQTGGGLPPVLIKSIAKRSPKDKGAQLLGKMGGDARAEALSAERRSEIAREAARKRWAKKPN